MQEKLTALQKGWQSNEIATKIQEQKSTELNKLKSRWKDGMLQEAEEEKEELPHKTMATTQNTVQVRKLIGLYKNYTTSSSFYATSQNSYNLVKLLM